MLATARLESTGLPARLGEVDVTAMLAELAERARHDPLVARSPVTLAPGAPLTLVADEALLRRALWNLIENAAKYGAPPITLAAERTGERVSLSVTDAGPGIPAASRQRVLDPFTRLDVARTPGVAARGGFGLGLTFARRVAEVHGGGITIGPAEIVAGAERGCRVGHHPAGKRGGVSSAVSARATQNCMPISRNMAIAATSGAWLWSERSRAPLSVP